MTREAIVAVSISDAPDREKLGFPAREVQRVLFTVCTHLIRSEFEILYSGDLRPGGYTLEMFAFLAGTYAGQGVEPFISLLPEPTARDLSYDQLLASLKAAQGVARLELVMNDEIYPVRLEGGALLLGPKHGDRRLLRRESDYRNWVDAFPVAARPEGFSSARRLGSRRCFGRVSLGGKMGLHGAPADAYEGAMPGIVEEAIFTIEAGGAYFPLGAFGGATRDVAISLGLLAEEQRVPRGAQADSYASAMNELQVMQARKKPVFGKRTAAIAASDRAEELAAAIAQELAMLKAAYPGA